MLLRLPNADHAVVPRAKIVDYLLSLTHQVGRAKARWFLRRGYTAARWTDLANALLDHARTHEVTQTEPSPFGTRYIIEGEFVAADGRAYPLRSVWFVDTGDVTPRFVTAYPLPRAKP